MDVNPYAPPLTSFEVEPPQGCWREGKVLVMRVGSTLPHRCVKCNDAAVQPIKIRRITWHSPGWYILILLNIVIYAIVAAIVSKRQKIAPGLCARHLRRRRVFLLAGWIGLFAGVFAISAGASGDAPGWAIAGLVALLLSIIAGFIGSRLVYPSRITSEEIYLKGCGGAFLDSLEGRP